jgi:histidinol-phosphate/aromatic aminotransferase/cobyric acid decarboxylase-like protein
MLDAVYKDYDNRLLHWKVIIDMVNSGSGTPVVVGAGADDFINQAGSGYAKGADFIVPPGYPNDSYPMRVQSGEHVVVTPPGQNVTGGTTINNFYGLSVDEVMRRLHLQGPR